MRMVIKVGTSTLTHPNGRMNLRSIEAMVRVISDLKNQGHHIVLVSSGAIGMGIGKLMLSDKPEDMAMKQATAAVGQVELMRTYDRLFNEYNHTIGQILLTAEDVENEDRLLNFQNTAASLLAMNVLPIINENDSVCTEQIALGDNDTLGAIVAKCVEADLMVMLSDIKGLYTSDPQKNPDAKMLRVVEVITPEIEALAGTTVHKLGTGGMATKLKAAKIVTEAGCDMVITHGKDPEVIYDILDGKSVGTRFPGKWDHA